MFTFQVSELKIQGIKCRYADNVLSQGWELNPFIDNVLYVFSLLLLLVVY